MIKISMERGSLFRVILGIVAVLFFTISALSNQENIYFHLFLVLLGLNLTWREYSLYRMKQQEKDISTFED